MRAKALTMLGMSEPFFLQCVDQVRAAVAAGTPVSIRGGNTKAFYGPAGPLAHSEIDVRSHAGVVNYEPSELVITARAGTPLAEVEAVLASQGQCLPFEPPRFGAGGTVGGMVAAGLSGPARASVGAVRDYVLGLHLLNGRGELMQFGGQVMKNVAGYDVSRLMVGSLGALGLITEVSLKVLPVAPGEATLVFDMGQQAALDQLNRWGAQPLPLNASCWVHDPLQGGRECLYLRLRGAVAAVESACERMLREQSGYRMDSAAAAPDWSACRDQQLPFFVQAPDNAVLWRLSVPQTAPALGLPFAPLVEWHGALRWIWAPLSAAAAVQAAASAVGGSAMLFRADNVYRDSDRSQNDLNFCAQQRMAPLAPVLAGIHQRLKAEFDPAGIFNPGRLWGHV
jgi:glycolate oxidase FAD binding subunit